jgi:segregation and condensation protein A
VTVVDVAPAKPAFAVRVTGFEGPLDLLLSLISKHELELTALALHRVTDDFVAYIAQQGDAWDLGEATEFLVIAATLLDLKATRLLPTDEEPDEEDLALLEARDLLFSRLLQYRAYKKMSAVFEERLHGPQLRVPRTAGLDPDLTGLLPELAWTLTVADLAALVASAAQKHEPPEVSVSHIHGSAVSVREQAGLLAARLRRIQSATFSRLTADRADRLHLVARFLAVLELYRAGLVLFEQEAPMAELRIQWIGGHTSEFDAAFDEFDTLDQAEAPA